MRHLVPQQKTLLRRRAAPSDASLRLEQRFNSRSRTRTSYGSARRCPSPVRQSALKQRVKWQAWGSDEGITFAPASRIEALRADGMISSKDSMLHELVASTGEDAMTQHHEKMGWEPYRPQGNPAPCPNGCGGHYYPLGYGDCPNCGHIG